MKNLDAFAKALAGKMGWQVLTTKNLWIGAVI